MARLWSCGFEMQSNVDLIEVQDFTPNLGATISTTVKRAPGTASARVNPASGANCLIEHQFTSGVVMRTFHRFYIRVDTLPAGASNIYHIGQSGYFPANIQLRTDGTLILRDSNAAVDLGSPTAFALTLGRWYRIEADYTDVAGTLTPGVSAFKLYVDGVLVSDQMCSNINGFSRVRMGTTNTGGGLDMYIDDIAVNDDTGSYQNGLPGPGCVVHMLPDAAGDNNLWGTAIGGTAGAANNFTRVNERVPNDSTSYNQTAATGTTTIDDFNMQTAASAGIGTADLVNVVSVGVRGGSDATTTASICTRLKSQSGGTVAESPSVSVATNGWNTHRATVPRIYYLNSYVDPQAGGPWTAALLNNAQIGYRTITSQTTTRRVTSLWALVDFVPRFALGVAHEGNSAKSLVYAKGNAPLKTLFDDFNDNTIDTLIWPNSYGTRSETGGRARVSVDTSYNAFSSSKGYDLTGSEIVLQVYPPTMGDGASEAWAQVLIKSVTDGTDLGFEFRISSGEIIPFKRVGYFDAEAPAYTYNATNHRWVRIKESGGNVTFDVSPDGHAWTNLRTVTTPSYADDGDLEVQLAGHRADGTNNYVEFDNVNNPGNQLRVFGVAATSNTARALRTIRRVPVGAGSSSSTGKAVTRRKTAHQTPASAGSHATLLGRFKTFHLGVAHEGVCGKQQYPVRFISLGVAAAVEVDANGLAWSKRRTIGAAGNPAQGRPVISRKTGAINAASSVNSGTELAALKLTRTGAAGSTNSARGLVAAKAGDVAHAAGTDHANSVRVIKLRVLGAAASGSISRALRPAHRYSMPAAGVEAQGYPVVARRDVLLGTAHEESTATTTPYGTSTQVHPALVADGGRPVTARKLDPRPTPAESVDQGRAVHAVKLFHLGAAHTITSGKAVKASRINRVGSGTVTNSATEVTPSKMAHLVKASEVGTARPLTIRKLRTLGRAAEVSTVHAVDHRRISHLGATQTQETAEPISHSRRLSIVSAHLTEYAAGVAGSKRRTVGRCAVKAGALQLRPSKRLMLGVAHEVAEATEVTQPERIRLLVNANALDRANPVRVSRQRPGSVVKPGTSGPILTPGTQGGAPRTGVTGPNLIATSTTGGS